MSTSTYDQLTEGISPSSGEGGVFYPKQVAGPFIGLQGYLAHKKLPSPLGLP